MTGKAPRHLNAPSSCTSSRFRYTSRSPASSGGAGSRGVAAAMGRRVSRMERVQLFATCLGDLLFPDAVSDAETLLRDAGFEVEFPAAQVCCGQPAFNSGHPGA